MELQISQLYTNKYFDDILLYHYNRNNADKIYDDKNFHYDTKPSLLIIRFDIQLIFVKYQKIVLLIDYQNHYV
jgi:hypothetical protein